MQNKYYGCPEPLRKTIAVLIFISAPLLFFAQDISGLYTGILTNDSTGRKQNFEIALSEYRGKITGYSYTTFIANDTFYYSIKRVEGERKDGFLVVKDVKMENNNFPESPAKKVKQTVYFPLINDSTIDVSRGRWETNRTKIYYSIGGKAELQKKEDDKESNLLAHLSELGIESNIAFDSHKKVNYQDGKKDVAKNEKPKKPVTTADTPAKPAIKPPAETEPSKEAVAVTVPKEAKPEPVSGNQQPAIATVSVPVKKEEVKPPPPPVVVKAEPEIKSRPEPVVKNEKPVTLPASSVPPPVVAKKEEKPVVNKTVQDIAKTTVPPPPANTKPADTKPVVKKPEPPVTVAAPPTVVPGPEKKIPVVVKSEPVQNPAELPTAVAVRKNEVVKQLTFKSDSLIIALYDNGVVDGDSVSVFVNGMPILEKQMLKVSATKKTIYTSAYPDSVQIVLFAENLGSIGSNTGLMTIRDGEDIYEVRFSADLKQNAAITLRRKRN